MKRILLFAMLWMAGAAAVIADQGWLDSFVYVWPGANPNVWYDLNGSTGKENLHGADLGTYDPNSIGLFSSLYLNSEMNAWSDGGDYYDNDGFRLYYRVYRSGEGAPSWQNSQSTSAQFLGDNNWKAYTPGVNIISGLSTGSYNVDVFAYKLATNANGSSWEERIYQTDEEPFIATFDVIPEPATFSLLALGLGLAAFMWTRRRA